MRAPIAMLVLTVGIGCAPAEEPVGRASAALGEPTDGFPTWEERVVHVWTNRARADPAADLASCTVCAEAACYGPVAPAVWTHSLARAARFHSDNLVRAGCSLQHDSPCTVVSDIDARYTPGSCDGSPSCACNGGSATCGSMGTGFGARLGLFGSSARAENIATGSDPLNVFYRWLHEADSSSACGWRVANGHRANILGDASTIGVGSSLAGNVWTQDFGTGGAPDGLVAGVHYPDGGSSIEFRANWYRPSEAPTMALVNIDGVCTPMDLERGVAGHATYLATVTGLTGCVRYFFQFHDGTDFVTYPTNGSYSIGCGEDWTAARPAYCGCTPDCSGADCGNDGCGGGCGLCTGGSTCSARSCVCPGGTMDCGGTCADTSSDDLHCGGCDAPCGAMETCTAGTCTAVCVPDCSGRDCGSDGCGGNCGACSGGRACSAGSCVCSGGRTDCGGSCVRTDTNADHCGGCGNVCGPSELCTAGSCVCQPSCGARTCGDDGCGGSCGACASDRICSDGSCACTGASSACGADCVDVRIDEAHCGGCDSPCGAAEVCVAGVCGDPPVTCVPACEGRDCGDDTCGGDCGTCGPGRLCGTGGQCICSAEATDCSGECTDLRIDPANCGACGETCAAGQRCVGGACTGEPTPLDGGPDGGGLDGGLGDGGAQRIIRGACGCSAPGASRPLPLGWMGLSLMLVWVRRRAA